MINQLKNPYQFWNHPIFTKPKGAIRPPQTQLISYKQATRFRDFALSYFNSDLVDATTIRLRKPPSETANIAGSATISSFNNFFLAKTEIDSDEDEILSKEKSSFESMKIYAANKTYTNHFTSLGPAVSYQFRFLAYRMKNKEYDELISSLETLMIRFPQMALLPIYGFLAAICNKSENDENKFFHAIEHSYCEPQELSHYYHLFDELCAIAFIEEESKNPKSQKNASQSNNTNISKAPNKNTNKNVFSKKISKNNTNSTNHESEEIQNSDYLADKYHNKYPLLLHLLMGDVDDLIHEMCNRPHIIPIISLNASSLQNPFHFVPHLGSRVVLNPAKKAFDSLTSEKIKARSQMPKLMLVPEEIKLVPYNEEQLVGPKDLFDQGRYEESITLATKLIKAGHFLHNNYIYRAFAFTKTGRYTNAIVDLTEALNIKYNEQAKQLREHLWRCLGQVVYDDEEFLQSFDEQQDHDNLMSFLKSFQ
ncbi:hypothetical protein TRFO_26572 [Tritrichomonas foetus]|uniref:TPR Domain containing protein n=1 Tax=Tritrichomonas foetus TaxID=1144522 RepID=A0A1J4K454_9EUKA|nr:hypothetical protein TRFO_26572 [Tritrichomonas foetus]|eukprot:OHT05624.1 hypothetical protein TRFO_26572 [Tritrichomonas foetus]